MIFLIVMIRQTAVSLSLLFCATAFSQVLKFQDINKLSSANSKATTYISSNNISFSIGDLIKINSARNLENTIPFLSRQRGKKPVSYKLVNDIPLKIYKIKQADSAGFKYASFIVFDENTYIKYVLNVESAIRSNKLTLISEVVKIEAGEDKIAQIDTLTDQEITTPLKVLQTDMVTLPPVDNKEMLLMSAVEMKRFTTKYNNSLKLVASGVIFTSLRFDYYNTSNKVSPFAVIGSVLILGGAWQGISARQHIGKSGAYLEAYANGVTITF
jgi:hypothetical protein